MPHSLSSIVAQLGGELVGQDINIQSVKTLSDAGCNDISFLSNPKYKKQLDTTLAGAIIVAPNMVGLPENKSYIVADDPYLYFAQVLHLLYPPQKSTRQVHETAVIHRNATVPDSCEIGAFVVIGENTRLGENCRILSGSVIGDNCVLGDECVLYPNVVLYPKTHLGNRVMIHANSVIGADGFGNARTADKTWCKIPQIGGVVIGDDTEIGANSNIDRGALGNTEIGSGCRIDNQVQIGHNCVVGNHTAIAACTGISGSTKIGNYCIIGGAAMFVGHIEIADHTIIGGGTAVTRSIDKPDFYATCYPIQTQKEWVKNAVHIRHLNELSKRVKALEKQLAMSSEQ
ncbi:MAG: UDP-3-O-(3-hydroxymyristoyl)glucosamine N-acyltransferase [Neisseriaceae bacterium]|nr:UDP-3-O-(3-hydroxymyristoyl)glucosamine N-acyltransferase [Neisseriaceae bacterium]